MSEKDRRRKKRKAKGTRRPRDREHYVPLNIPEDVNLYEMLKERLRTGDTLDLAMVNVDLEEYVARVDRTLDHFKIRLDKCSSAGNLLIRMAWFQSLQEPGFRMIVNDADPVLSFAADLLDHFNSQLQ